MSFDFGGISVRPEVTCNHYSAAIELPADGSDPTFNYLSLRIGLLIR